MSAATRSPWRSIASHAVLLSYTLIALFPVFVIVMQLVQEPQGDLHLAAVAAGRAELLADRLRDGDEARRFPALLPEQPDRHRGVAGVRAAVRRDGRLRAHRVPVQGQHAAGPVPRGRDHDPDPAGHGGDPADHGGNRTGQHADGAHPRLHRPGPAALDLHPLRVHEDGFERSARTPGASTGSPSTRSSSRSCCRWCGRRWPRSRSSP